MQQTNQHSLFPIMSSSLTISQRSQNHITGLMDQSLDARKSRISTSPPFTLVAKAIVDLESIFYPPGIKRPDIEGNIKGGKFRYDRDFLLQFRGVCKHEPDSVLNLEKLGIRKKEGDDPGLSGYTTRGRAAGRRQKGSISSGFGNPLKGVGGVGGPSQGGMGNFSISSAILPPATVSSSKGKLGVFVGDRPNTIENGLKDGDLTRPREKRTRSQRGRQRNSKDPSKANNVTGGDAVVGPLLSRDEGSTHTPRRNRVMKDVIPLQITENRWLPASKLGRPPDGPNYPDMVECKVMALLNKLTVKNFESISNQIIGCVNQQEKDGDGRKMTRIIKLIFEKAVDEPHWSGMYARLCRRMMEHISQNDWIRNIEGNPTTGGQLFRNYLLSRCQEDFKHGWSISQSAATTPTKSHENQATVADAAKKKKNHKEDGAMLYTSDCDQALKAKRSRAGLVKFIGELFKLGLLPERIVHGFISKLLSSVSDLREEDAENLCKLLAAVGQGLDNAKTKGHMEVYFSRLSELSIEQRLTTRVRYMLQDTMELRHRRWLPRREVSQLHNTPGFWVLL